MVSMRTGMKLLFPLLQNINQQQIQLNILFLHFQAVLKSNPISKSLSVRILLIKLG